LASGALWLKLILGLSFTKAIILGIMPFIAGDMLKAAAATFIYGKLRSRIKEIF
jgi:biotin transporter BioY